MSGRDNELFIGIDYMAHEGRTIKHPALIRKYATVNPNKTKDEHVDLYSLDLETDADTGELKLLGFYADGYYRAYTNNFLETLFMYLKKAKGNGAALAYWNRLDPFILLKQFLLVLPDHAQYTSLDHFGKIAGEWDKDAMAWTTAPVCEVEIEGYKVGIKNAIRSSVQFYYRALEDDKLHTIWAFDIAQLYHGSLEKESKARFDYYTKVDDSAHIVDWERFKIDNDYRNNIVLKSNELDARACYDLGIAIQEDFKNAFGFYPKTLVSQGSLARAAITAELYRHHERTVADEKELKALIKEDVKSIGIMNYYDKWASAYGGDFLKDFYALLTESYSGGYIESIRYGYSKTGWHADIASAYPAIIKDLYDIRGATIEHGTGEPKRAKYGYTFVRGLIKIPTHVNYHPVTVKHFINKDTNIRPVGEFIASYTLEERDYLLERGATFKNEHWYMVETNGKKSALATVCKSFIQLRKELKAAGSSSEHMAKIAANSLYGILFECVDTYQDYIIEKKIQRPKDKYYRDKLAAYKHNIDLSDILNSIKYLYDADYQKVTGLWHNAASTNKPDTVAMELAAQGVHIDSKNALDILVDIDTLYRSERKSKNVETFTQTITKRAGYRAGEFWNPLFATIITARTRLLMAKASDAIEKKGGKPIILMTDSITWQGTKDMLPAEYVRDVKTLGYFETPIQVHDIVCLGSGRYGFKDSNGYVTTKRRGLNAVEMHDPDGMAMDTLNWLNALEIMRKYKSEKIDVKVRTLISNGVIKNNHKYKVEDLGRIVDEIRQVDAIVGKSKRFYDEKLKDPVLLSKTLVDTTPIELGFAMNGKPEYPDQTLPALRTIMMGKKVTTIKQRKKKRNKDNSKKHYRKIRDDIAQTYAYLRKLGYEVKDANRMARWSDARLYMKLEEDKHV